MTDILLSSFLSLFALFGKEESVDEAWAKTMLENYLRHHFGIRNIESYLGFYSDLRNAYEMSDVTGMDPQATVDGICTELKSKISHIEASLLLLRLMEFCSYQEGHTDYLFTTMAKSFQISDVQFKAFVDFVNNRQNEHVMIHELSDTKGQLKTLLNPETGMLLFTYTGPDTVLLNDVPVLSGAYQVWIQSSVLKGATGKPIYYSTILDAYRAVKGLAVDKTEEVEFCGRDINFRFPNSDNGMHDLSFTLRNGELLAIMGGSGTGKTTLLSLLNGTLKPQSGSITINGHDISEPDAKALIGFVPQDDLLIEELTVYQNLWFTAKLCFEGMSEEDLDKRVMKTLKDLGLDAAKNLKVGSAINKFISGGQRKRLNIALELIREPAVLFLDEPAVLGEDVFELEDAGVADREAVLLELLGRDAIASGERLDHHGHVDAGDAAERLLGHAAHDGVGGRAAEEVGEDEDAVAFVELVDRGHDALLELIYTVAVVQPDCTSFGLDARDERNCIEQSLAEVRMGDDNDSDHVEPPILEKITI